MKTPLLLVLTLLQLQAAVKTVCPAAYRAGCTFADLQKAFDAVVCGDELQIAPVEWIGNYGIKTACPGKPITVTTMRKAFLPASDTRISPSHAWPIPGVRMSTGNIPMLITLNATAPLVVYFPADGWNFIGIGFTSRSRYMQYDRPFTYQLVNMNGTDPTNENLLTDHFLFDRVYVTGPEDNSVYVQNGIYMQTRTITIRNSVCKDVALSGAESHCFEGSDLLGPVTITNNFVSAAGIPILIGGSVPRWWNASRHDGNVPLDFKAELNYFFKPRKWWPDPVNNPDYADYQTIWGAKATADHPCTKNLGELKNAFNALWQYNVHENQWDYFPCEGQDYGIALTPREMSGAVTQHNGGTVSDPVTLTWSEEGWKATVGQWVCPLVRGSFSCREITVVDNEHKTVKVSPLPSGWPVGPVEKWLYSWDASESVQNATVSNSIFRNVAGQTNVLGQSFSVAPGTPGSGKAVTLQNARIVNNLWYNTHRQKSAFTGWRAYTADWNMDPKARVDPVGLVYDHNAWYVPDSLNPAQTVREILSIGNWPGASGAPFDQFAFTNNIAPPSQYPVFGAAAIGPNLSGALSTFMTGNAQFLNNVIPGMSAPNNCKAPQKCSGNQAGKVSMDSIFVDPRNEDFRIKPSSPYAKAGTGGTAVGPDVSQLPFINNLTVTPGRHTARMEWDLTAVNNLTPCVVEISTSRNLYSGVGPYSVVNDVNPVLFIRPDY